tara:strand:- start:662 stop:1987 length:1326 start_codon:yes stop_codon:yes gene_type:complete
MVTVNKNNIVYSDNIGLKRHKIFKEDLDGIFAELFSLVNMENIETNEKSSKNLLDAGLKNKEVFEFNNNFTSPKNSEENFLSAAQSLVSLFYKELNLDNPDEELKGDRFIKPKEVQFENHKNLNDPKLVYKVETKESEQEIFDSELKKDEKFLTNKENSQILSIKKKILNKDKSNFQNTKNNLYENNNESKKTSDQQVFNDEKSIVRTEILVKKVKNEISKKKINKNKINNQSYKVDVKFENKEIKNSRDFNSNFNNTFLQQKNQKNQVNLIEKSNSNKNHNSKALINNLESQKGFNDKSEILDLMESAWGEKFIRIIKNNISRGINRINLSLEPKNLGRLKIEVEATEKEIELKILSDNKQTVTILNENSQRLNEMLKQDDLKFSNFSNMFNQNNSNSKNKNSEKKSENFNKKIGNKVQIQKNNEVINTKKSNHKVDKIA